MIEAFLRHKKRFNIGIWKVRILREKWAIAQLVREMRNYDFDIMGPSEIREEAHEQMRLGEGEIIPYSCLEDNLYRDDVALLMKKGGDESLM